MSRSGFIYLYNVYIDGSLVLENATNKQAAELTGCNMQLINKYAVKGYNHTKDGKTIRFEIVDKVPAKGWTKWNKREKTELTDVRAGWMEEWDKWRILALKALRSPAAIRRYRAARR